MKTLDIALASLLMVASAASAAPLKGSMKIGRHEDFTVGFGFREQVVNLNQKAKGWGLKSPWFEDDSWPPGVHRKNHSGTSMHASHSRWLAIAATPDVSSDVPTVWPRLTKQEQPGVHGFEGNSPSPSKFPVATVSLLRVAAVSAPSQQVPDSGNSLVLLGLSALGFGGFRRLLRKG